MGQPYQGQGQGQGQGGPFEGSRGPWSPTGPGGSPPARRSRASTWIALACIFLVLVLGFLAITGGVLFLVLRDGDDRTGGDGDPTTDEAQEVLFEHEYFSFSYPAEWFSVDQSAAGEESGAVVKVTDEEIDPEDYEALAPNSLIVYVFDSDTHALVTCQAQAHFTGFAWESSGDPEELDPVTLGGQELPAHRTTGTHDGQDVVGEMYCADAGDQVVQIVAETHGATEFSPEIRAILDSWVWVEE